MPLPRTKLPAKLYRFLIYSLNFGIALAQTSFLCASAAVSEDFDIESVSNSQIAPAVKLCDFESQRSGTVILVHGTTQHAGSFASLAKHLSKGGFTVLSLDLRGHGRRYWDSVSGEEERSVDYRKSTSDLIQIIKTLRKSDENTPLFCLGESVGAAVVTKAAASTGNLLDGVVLCSAGTRPRFFDLRMTVPDFLKGIVCLDTQMDVSRYIDKYSADDKRISDEMIEDPLSRIRLTPIEILRTSSFIRSTPNSAKHLSKNLPVLVITGAKDSIVQPGSVKSIFNSVPSRDKELLVLPNYGHVLLGTKFLKPDLVANLQNWLISHARIKQSNIVGMAATEK